MAKPPTLRPRDPREPKPLSDRQRLYVDGRVRGLIPSHAGKAAGLKPSYVRTGRVEKVAGVKAAIAAAQAELREKTMYNVTEAVKEIDRAIVFGYQRNNPMSVAKLLELKSKLHGLLVDRVEVLQVSLVGALDEAKRRAFEREPAALVHGGVQDLIGEKGKQTPESPREPNAWREQTAYED